MDEKWVPVTDLIAVLEAMQTGKQKLQVSVDIRQFAGIHPYGGQTVEFERTIKFRLSEDG